MARKKYPDHAGRMPDHPRYGNPSDESEEVQRILGAQKNLEDWQDRYGGQFSGAVSMSYGPPDDSASKYTVQIGDTQIANKISGRPIAAPEVKALPEPAEAASEPLPIPVQLPPQQSVLFWLIDRIKGVFR